MKIIIEFIATVYEGSSDIVVEDTNILKTIDNEVFRKDSCYNHLDLKLINLGIIGGNISFFLLTDDDFGIRVEFWAPKALSSQELEALKEDTIAQMEDGIGDVV